MCISFIKSYALETSELIQDIRQNIENYPVLVNILVTIVPILIGVVVALPILINRKRRKAQFGFYDNVRRQLRDLSTTLKQPDVLSILWVNGLYENVFEGRGRVSERTANIVFALGKELSEFLKNSDNKIPPQGFCKYTKKWRSWYSDFEVLEKFFLDLKIAEAGQFNKFDHKSKKDSFTKYEAELKKSISKLIQRLDKFIEGKSLDGSNG